MRFALVLIRKFLDYHLYVQGSKFNLTDALSCKNGGFVSIRHNEVTTQFLKEVYSYVRKEPPLKLVETSFPKNIINTRKTNVWRHYI